MQLTMTDIIALRELYPQLKESKVPAKLAYKLICIFDEVDKQSAIYTKMFTEIINDCAKKDEQGLPIFTENGTQVSLLEDKIEECGERMKDLNTLKVDLIIKYPLNLDDLDLFNDLTIEQIKLLAPFIQ